MSYGYKARSLKALEEKGLPTLSWGSYEDPEEAFKRAVDYWKDYDERWAIRVDRPENTGIILPLLGSNLKTGMDGNLIDTLWEIKDSYSDCSFIVSEAPDDSTRDSNIVCYMDGAEMFGEISLAPMTLRSAWTKEGGRLKFFGIDGSVGDYLRNQQMIKEHTLNVNRVEYLRKIRNLIKHLQGEDFEISVTHTGRIIFWQSIAITDDRNYLVFKHV